MAHRARRAPDPDWRADADPDDPRDYDGFAPRIGPVRAGITAALCGRGVLPGVPAGVLG